MFLVESNELKINEIKEEKKGAVIGSFTAPSFFFDSFSRNGRFYPKEAWINALSKDEFKERLKKQSEKWKRLPNLKK